MKFIQFQISAVFLLIGFNLSASAADIDSFLAGILEYQRSNPTVLIKSTADDGQGNTTRAEELWDKNNYFGKFWLEHPVSLYFESFFDEQTGQSFTYLPVSNVLIPEKDVLLDALKRATKWGEPVDISLLQKHFEMQINKVEGSDNFQIALTPKTAGDNQVSEILLVYSNSGKPLESSIVVAGSKVISKIEVITDVSADTFQKWQKPIKESLPKPSDQSFILAAIKEYLLTKTKNKENTNE